MKKVRTEDAVGFVLCHDITKIVPGEFKGRAFKKGHIVRPEDVPELLKLGKDHLYVWEQGAGTVHEDDAANRLALAVAGTNLEQSAVSEGKINLSASVSGLLKVDRVLLEKVNSIEQVVLATRHNNILVQKGDVVAGTRVIPLVIDEQKICAVERICQGKPVLKVKNLQRVRAGLVTTGNEVYHGRITDKFGPVLKRKLAALGSAIAGQVFVPDDIDAIKQATLDFIGQGVDMVLLSGGMSVDPDDLTPGAIKATGAQIIGYGAPVLPGSMFLLAYLGEVPIIGLPGCVMYCNSTVFDLVLPRILAGERLTRSDLVALAYGGLCQQCPECRYPACSFGKA
ncbi:MAG TPA: molybdopterin-binding protein [Desulfobacteria bacterium]|nr:molybdopterin-binding protein [Desulfobacteria bacterium]